jgi:CDP-glycerol glycerophosphotransferase (TagB/SpsB family)
MTNFWIIRNILYFYYYLINISQINNINKILSSSKNIKEKNILVQIQPEWQYQHVSAIINLLLNNKDYHKIVLSCNHPDYFKGKIDKRILLIEANIGEYLSNISICLKCNFEDRSPRNSVSVFLGHGFLVKRQNIPRVYLENIDHVFLYGPSTRNIFNNYLKNSSVDKNNIKFWNTGYPNYDDIVNSNYNLNKIKKMLSLKKNNSILFSPAWENHHQLYHNIDALCLIFSKIKKYNFIIKVHPNWLIKKENNQDFYFYSGGYNWKKKLKSIQKKFNNIYFYQDVKIQPLFDICKLMITDFSGVSIGCALRKKPVIFFNDIESHRENLIKLGYEKKINNLILGSKKKWGIEINHYSQIEKAIQKITSNYKFYQKELDNFQEKHLYNPGRAAVIACKILNSIISR